MADYESELTSFLKGLVKSKPDIVRKQAEGRAKWWDKQLDVDELQRWQASRVRQTGYVYYAAQKPAEVAKEPLPTVGSGIVKPAPTS
jgi:hypothetical protein